MGTSYSGLNHKCNLPSDCHCGYKCMHTQGTASKLLRAHTTPRSGPRPLAILNGCCHMLAIALQRAKGRDGGKKQSVGQRQKLLFEMKSELLKELSTTFRRATQTPSPVRVLRTTGRRHLSQCPLPKARCARAQTKLLVCEVCVFLLPSAVCGLRLRIHSPTSCPTEN